MTTTEITLVRPARRHLGSYEAALMQGWSPDNLRGLAVTAEHLTAIEIDADLFLDLLDDRQAKGAPITLPNGEVRPRLPGYVRWIWDGAFAGTIGFRWQLGTSALPDWVLGHVGYGVVPWRRGLGYATRALALMLPECRAAGLDYVEVTTTPDNLASCKVIEANGGVLVERFIKPDVHAGQEALRYRIDLTAMAR